MPSKGFYSTSVLIYYSFSLLAFTFNFVPKPLLGIAFFVASTFFIPLVCQSGGKDILIDKFWFVRLAFERLGNVLWLLALALFLSFF